MKKDPGNSMCQEVPEEYRGLWRRTVLETPQGRDAESQVFWLQTAHWHADLRIPDARPDFGKVHLLQECTRSQLEWLLRQEGFAGVTQVEGDVCVWHRHVDYRPSGYRDIGRMRFGQDYLDESGMEQNYTERWAHEALAEREFSARQAIQGGQRRLLLQAGEYFMHVCPRRIGKEKAQQIWGLVGEGRASLDEMRQLADFEISLAIFRDGNYLIRWSTLPWLEGCSLQLDCEWSSLEEFDIDGEHDER